MSNQCRWSPPLSRRNLHCEPPDRRSSFDPTLKVLDSPLVVQAATYSAATRRKLLAITMLAASVWSQCCSNSKQVGYGSVGPTKEWHSIWTISSKHRQSGGEELPVLPVRLVTRYDPLRLHFSKS